MYSGVINHENYFSKNKLKLVNIKIEKISIEGCFNPNHIIR